MALKQAGVENQVITNIWIKQNTPRTDREAIKKDLITNLTCPNYQFTNLFHHYGEGSGYSIRSELGVEDNYKTPDSPYETKITVKSYFAIPSEVPSGTELVIPKKIIEFFTRKDRNFKKSK